MSKKKRFNMILPKPVFDKIKAQAVAEQTSVVDVIRRREKIGRMVEEIVERGGQVVFKENGEETKVIIL